MSSVSRIYSNMNIYIAIWWVFSRNILIYCVCVSIIANVFQLLTSCYYTRKSTISIIANAFQFLTSSYYSRKSIISIIANAFQLLTTWYYKRKSIISIIANAFQLLLQQKMYYFHVTVIKVHLSLCCLGFLVAMTVN